MYGEGFHIFKPHVPVDDDEYDVKIFMKHHQCFRPFPTWYDGIADKERLAVLVWIMENCPPDTLRPFRLTSSREISQEDKGFVLKIMQLDPRDRPTAEAFLEDRWFYDYQTDSFSIIHPQSEGYPTLSPNTGKY
jgi:serine/threonine protein kinase